jgi:lambda family phage minor tail protein L
MAYSAWASSTAYVVGDIVRASSLPGTGLVFKCIVAGTSASTEPTWPTVIYTTQTLDGTQSNKVGFVVDGTVTWAAIMAVSQDLQGAALSSIIELFELQLDATLHGGSDIYRFHAGANALNTPGDVIWNGNSYLRYPVQVEGFEWNGQGQLPRPKLSISNLASTISALLLIVNEETPNNDLIGAKLTRIRTLARYLDNVNFEGGVNPSGAVDPTAEFPRDIYYIARKSAENRNVVEFECAAAFDLQHVKAPRRLCINNVCQWTYRSAVGCGYDPTQIGPFWDAADQPATTLATDVCGKRLSSCILRFGEVIVNGNLTSGSNIMTNLTTNELARIRVGDPIVGIGLPDNTTVTAIGTNQLTLSNNATSTTTIVRNGTLTAEGTQMTVATVDGLTAGMTIEGTGIPSGTTIRSISGTTLTLSISSNDYYLDSATVKQVEYRVVGDIPRLYMSDTSGIAASDQVRGNGIYTNTDVVGISTDKFVQISQNAGAEENVEFAATFYTPRTFTSLSYTFRTNTRYTIRAGASLPFGSFPGVGNIKV